MFGYTRYDNSPEIVLKTMGWAALFGIIFSLFLVYAGFNTMYSRDGDLVGQAKKITLVTPFWQSICPSYYALDVSMGVLQGGTGSMSTQDVWFTVLDREDISAMKEAVKHAAIVKVKYAERRLYACTEGHLATGFEVIDYAK